MKTNKKNYEMFTWSKPEGNKTEWIKMDYKNWNKVEKLNETLQTFK